MFLATTPCLLALIHAVWVPAVVAATAWNGIADNATTSTPPCSSIAQCSNATHVSDVANSTCSARFTERVFAIFFSEDCLNALPATQHVPCPLEEVDKFLTILLGEFQIWSVSVAPVMLYSYVTVALLGNIPKTTGGCGSRIMYAMWLTLQFATCLFQMLSMLWYLFGYSNIHTNMGTCFTRVGSAPLVHLTMTPLAALQMTAINKMAPLFITVGILLMELADQLADHSYADYIADMVSTAVAVVLLLPLAGGILYSICSASFIFSFAFLPISCLMGVAVAMGLFMLFLANLCVGPLLVKLKEKYRLDLRWFMNGAELSKDPLTMIAGICLLLMIMAPFIVWGCVLAFALYAEASDGSALSPPGAGTAISWIYGFSFQPIHFRFQMPSFIDLSQFFDGFPDNIAELFMQLRTFLQMPSVHALQLGIAANVCGTMVSFLRSFIMFANGAFMTIKKGWGVETKALREVQWISQAKEAEP